MRIQASIRLKADAENLRGLEAGDFVKTKEGVLAKLKVTPRATDTLIDISISGGSKAMVRTATLSPTKFKFTPQIRAKLAEEIWKKSHKDFKGSTASGVKTLMVSRNGSTIVPIDKLTDDELFSLIKISV